MAICPFATWRSISGSSGTFVGGPYKIVHHTTEGSSAEGAMAAFATNRSDPHFTVDGKRIYQHIDTAEGARALRNAPGGVQTNRDSAVQIELVGFAHLPKDPKALTNLARLCRWIEKTHGVPARWPAGLPRPATNGRDPGGHNRDAATWDNEGGHYGHCHVPENTHWDPAYSAGEAEFLMKARFSAEGKLLSPAAPATPARAARGAGAANIPVSTMPGHGQVEIDKTSPPVRKKPARPRHAEEHAAAPQRVFNARPDTLDFRDRMYVPTLVEVPSTVPVEVYLKAGVPVLDQGTEGACTGFGLATVANYLLRRRVRVPDLVPVSPRMFYELARRYDEWPGEDYSGSSARGAMKGWNKHGIAADDDWPYHLDNGARDPGFSEQRLSAAKKRPLGAYFRVNHKDLIAMHAAIAEVGILYATAVVHEGWQNVSNNGIIEYSQSKLGGHATSSAIAPGRYCMRRWCSC